MSALRIFIKQEIVGDGRVFIQPTCRELTGILPSQTAAPPLTKHSSSASSVRSCCKLFNISVEGWRRARSLLTNRLLREAGVDLNWQCNLSGRHTYCNYQEKTGLWDLKKHTDRGLCCMVCVVMQDNCEDCVKLHSQQQYSMSDGRGSALTSSPSSPPGMHISGSLSGWSHACSEHLQEEKQRQHRG